MAKRSTTMHCSTKQPNDDMRREKKFFIYTNVPPGKLKFGKSATFERFTLGAWQIHGYQKKQVTYQEILYVGS